MSKGVGNVLVEIAHHHPRLVGITANANAIAREPVAEAVHHARSPQAGVTDGKALGQVQDGLLRRPARKKWGAGGGVGNIVLIDARASEEERVIAVLCDLVIDTADVPVLANRGRRSKTECAEIRGICDSRGIR